MAKSLLKNQQYKNVDSDLINKVAKTVAKERLTNPLFEESFFSDSTLKTIMFTSKSDVPKDVLDSFTLFRTAVDVNFDSINSEIHLAKTKGKFTDESGKEQNVSTRQIDLYIQVYASTDSIKQRLKTKGITSKKGKPMAFSSIIQESDEAVISWYASLARGILSYYSCADNFYKVKSIVNYQIR